ncbi:zinc-ribbon domain-containing protein [uncultured Bacteroides sp.]|uniref:zinc-ribbon domain-containing protein n=1 Tax=uncultured Bacteroides sp. TaxID=162156 RepID=UPI00259B3264|nr:zinc-ribbon domain-containing protein [uncultured Bacteroides sp.]
MFCPKCGTKALDGAEFCQKCGAKLILDSDGVQPSAGIPTYVAEPQQTSVAERPITENTQHIQPNNPPKGNSSLHKAAIVGRVLMWGCGILMLLPLPIPPAILGAGAAIGIILSILGAERPLGLSKIMELVSAVIVLVLAVMVTLSSGGRGDKYVQLVRDGTLEAYPQMTVGEAFDGFLSDPKWESGLSDDNVRFVNVKGGALYFGEEAELAVQFIIVDEKEGSFQYNACEVDGTPQNNLVFWGLLETIYGDPSSKGLDSQDEPDFISNKITIDETQSYDNEYGNIEVTLNYAAFTDKLDNTLLGGYIYPDEGNVFLWADVTVKNIGTENGYLSASSRVVYDGTYEFQSDSTVGDLLGSIAPLTAPTEGAIIFEVPIIVMESDSSLVFNIDSGEVVLSYVIRPGNGTSGDNIPSALPEGSIANDLTFRGTSLTEWIGGPADTAYDTFGWPDYGTIIDDSLYNGGEYFGYNIGVDSGISFIIDYQTDRIGWITGVAEAFEVNGTTLDITRAELIDLLGTPESEETVSDELEGTEYYAMRYVINGLPVEITLPDANSIATSIMISQ